MSPPPLSEEEITGGDDHSDDPNSLNAADLRAHFSTYRVFSAHRNGVHSFRSDVESCCGVLLSPREEPPRCGALLSPREEPCCHRSALVLPLHVSPSLSPASDSPEEEEEAIIPPLYIAAARLSVSTAVSRRRRSSSSRRRRSSSSSSSSGLGAASSPLLVPSVTHVTSLRTSPSFFPSVIHVTSRFHSFIFSIALPNKNTPRTVTP